MKSLVNGSAERPQTNVVAFKLDEAAYTAFKKLAARENKSPGILAKDLALNALGAGVPPVRADITDELGKLSSAIAESVYVLLIKAGGVSPAEAASWTRETWPEHEQRQ